MKYISYNGWKTEVRRLYDEASDKLFQKVIDEDLAGFCK